MYIKKVTKNKKKQTSPGYHLKVVIYHVPIWIYRQLKLKTIINLNPCVLIIRQWFDTFTHNRIQLGYPDLCLKHNNLYARE